MGYTIVKSTPNSSILSRHNRGTIAVARSTVFPASAQCGGRLIRCSRTSSRDRLYQPQNRPSFISAL